MNERYRRSREGAADPWESRRVLVAHARAHGVAAAAREFGAGVSTVYRLLKESRETADGEPPRRRQGRPPLSLDQVVEIVVAKLSNPELSCARLKKECGLRYGLGQIERVLRERGLTLTRPRPRRDPRLALVMARAMLLIAKAEGTLGTRSARRCPADVDVEQAEKRVARLAKRAARRSALPEKERKPSPWVTETGGLLGRLGLDTDAL
jgi:transposase